MSKFLAALVDAIRFSRSYRRLSRITDDATRPRPHDTHATLEQAWQEVECARSQVAGRQRDIDAAARTGGLPSLNIALTSAAAETDFPA